MRFGTKCPKGFLPVYSVDTEDEAKRLLVLACKMGLDGQYYSPELAEEQTLERLALFSDKLEAVYLLHVKPHIARN